MKAISRSINTLKFNSVYVSQESNKFCINLKCKLEMQLVLRCPETNNVFMRIDIICENSGYSTDEAVRRSFQDFLDGNAYLNRNISCVDIRCNPHYGIDVVSKSGNETLDTFLSQILDKKNWMINKKLLTRPTSDKN